MSSRSPSVISARRSVDSVPTDGAPNVVQFGANVPPVRRSPTALARRFCQMCMGMQADGLATTDISAFQYGVLSILNRQTGEPGIDQNSVAARLGVDRSHASLLVEELVVKGLVERRVDDADRRVRLLSLTPKAEKLYWRLRPGIRAANDRILEPLSPTERELFIDMLIRMIGANGAYALPGTRGQKRNSRPSSIDVTRTSRKSTAIDRGKS
jgi:DNA-binding MarR family transcriptional regulator